MRFTIKTLLLLTCLGAVILTLLFKPVMDASIEKRALSELEKQWEILTGADATLGWKLVCDKGIPPLSHWPAHWLLGANSVKRVSRMIAR